jgi:hypothetical protein
MSYCEGLRMICNPKTGVLSTSAKIMIDGVMQKLIPEIMGLKNGEVIPPEVYKKYPNKLIATTIVARKHDANENNANDPSSPYNFRNNSVIQMAFSEQYIDEIQKRCFLNQHQVQHSGGNFDPNRRAENEDGIAKIKLESSYTYNADNPANKVRPKFAGFAFKDAVPNAHDHLNTLANYGNVIAVFKDSVKDRTTFSPRNSLGYPNDTYTLDFRPKDWKPNENGNYYWEAQIWGELCLKDVDHFIVDCSGHGVTPQGMSKLKDTKLPVYKCNGMTPGGALKEGDRIN